MDVEFEHPFARGNIVLADSIIGLDDFRITFWFGNGVDCLGIGFCRITGFVLVGHKSCPSIVFFVQRLCHCHPLLPEGPDRMLP